MDKFSEIFFKILMHMIFGFMVVISGLLIIGGIVLPILLAEIGMISFWVGVPISIILLSILIGLHELEI